jgi:hypothetical protein
MIEITIALGHVASLGETYEVVKNGFSFFTEKAPEGAMAGCTFCMPARCLCRFLRATSI